MATKAACRRKCASAPKRKRGACVANCKKGRGKRTVRKARKSTRRRRVRR